jgi:hypothetical protein
LLSSSPCRGAPAATVSISIGLPLLAPLAEGWRRLVGGLGLMVTYEVRRGCSWCDDPGIINAVPPRFQVVISPELAGIPAQFSKSRAVRSPFLPPLNDRDSIADNSRQIHPKFAVSASQSVKR